MNHIDNLLIPFLQKTMKIQLKNIADPAIMYNTAQFILEEQKKMFRNFSSEYLRFKTYENNSYYIPPELYEIGSDNVFVRIRDETEVKEKSLYACHVPLRKKLEAFFAIPGMYEQIIKYIKFIEGSGDGHFTNMMQGSLWKSKYAVAVQSRLPSFLYFDDFPCRNALMDSAAEQKIGEIYVSLACLPPHLVVVIYPSFTLQKINVDEMHDKAGISADVLGKILTLLVNSNIISLQVLNNRIASFPSIKCEKK